MAMKCPRLVCFYQNKRIKKVGATKEEIIDNLIELADKVDYCDSSSTFREKYGASMSKWTTLFQRTNQRLAESNKTIEPIQNSRARRINADNKLVGDYRNYGILVFEAKQEMIDKYGVKNHIYRPIRKIDISKEHFDKKDTWVSEDDNKYVTITQNGEVFNETMYGIDALSKAGVDTSMLTDTDYFNNYKMKTDREFFVKTDFNSSEISTESVTKEAVGCSDDGLFTRGLHCIKVFRDDGTFSRWFEVKDCISLVSGKPRSSIKRNFTPIKRWCSPWGIQYVKVTYSKAKNTIVTEEFAYMHETNLYRYMLSNTTFKQWLVGTVLQSVNDKGYYDAIDDKRAIVEANPVVSAKRSNAIAVANQNNVEQQTLYLKEALAKLKDGSWDRADAHINLLASNVSEDIIEKILDKWDLLKTKDVHATLPLNRQINMLRLSQFVETFSNFEGIDAEILNKYLMQYMISINVLKVLDDKAYPTENFKNDMIPIFDTEDYFISPYISRALTRVVMKFDKVKFDKVSLENHKNNLIEL